MDGTGVLFTPFAAILPSHVHSKIIPLIQKVGLSYSEQAEYVATKIENRSVIVAESYSGMVAFELCRRFPEKVEQVIFVASFISRPSQLAKIGENIPLQLLRLVKRPNWLVLKVLFGSKLNKLSKELFLRTMSCVPTELLKYRLKQISQLKTPEIELSVPCTYLLARQDRLVSRNVLDVFRRNFSKVSVYELEGTHFLIQTNPEGVWDVIKAIVSHT